MIQSIAETAFMEPYFMGHICAKVHCFATFKDFNLYNILELTEV